MLFMSKIKMPIMTPRLLIRPIDKVDGEIVYDYKRESWNEFLPWWVWTHPPSIAERTVEDDNLFCAGMALRFEKGEDIPILAFDRQNDLLIGSGGLHRCDWEKGEFTLGFAVRTSKHCQGYATEIATALTTYAFKELNAKKVIVFHAEGNIGSQKVIENTGFEKSVVRPQCHELSSGFVDEHEYIMMNSDCLPKIDVSWK